MTSHHRKRFFSNDNTLSSTGTLSGSNSANTSPNHQVRIRVVDRNLSASSSQSSQRSQSPPDQLIADLSKSESDLRLLHQLHFSPVDQSMDSSYTGNHTTRTPTTTSPTHSGNFAGMDHSWTAGQASTSSTQAGNGMNGSGGNNNRRRASHNNLQRHHSGESLSLMRGYTSPRSRPELQRNRSPPIHSYSAGTVVGPSQSTRHRGSPRLTPKRNVSGEFHHHPHHHNHHHDTSHGQQSSPSGGPSVPNNSSPSTPYGMLNPGSSYQLHGRKGSNLHHHHHSRYHLQHYYHHSSNYTHNLLCSVWNSWINFFYSNGGNNPNNNNNSNKHMIALFGFCTLFILGMAVYQHDAMLQDALLLKGQEVEHHVRHAKELEKRVQALRQQNLQLQAQHQQELSSVSPDQEEMDLETQRKLFHWEHANLRMQHDIQQQSRRLLREKYGHGPKYYVQMKLEFDSHSNVYQEHADANALPLGDDDTIILETASIEDMPHSVYLFLEQVDHRLYDHTTFHRNAPHLVMAGPSNSPHAHALFRHSPSLNSVIFQEYALEMSHKQYTLGYSGRPGGPDFYVNMRDNSAIHGPGGQHHAYSDLTRDADPCFAKIVRGFETMERVHRSNVMDEGINNLMNTNNDAMVHPVIIEYMKVLPHDYVLPHSNTSSEEDEDEEDEDEDHHHHHHHHGHDHHDGHHGLRHQQQQRDNELETIM